jgi:hypothetical protein
VPAFAALPACSNKIAECNQFIDEANKGQTAFSKLDKDKEDALKSTITEVEASNKKLDEMKFTDAKLNELKANYITKHKAVLDIMSKTDDAAKAVKDATDKGDNAAVQSKVDELEKLKDQIDGAIKDASKSIDDLNAYCSGK